MKRLLTVFAAIVLITLVSANMPGDNDKSIAKVEPYNNIYWFIECNPLNGYKIIKEYSFYTSNIIFMSFQKEDIIKGLEIDKSKIDGVIVTFSEYPINKYTAKAIKFN